MRLSVDDPSHVYYEVYLDGVPMVDAGIVTEADEENGVVTVHVRDKLGNLLRGTEHFLTKTLHGDVDIEFSHKRYRENAYGHKIANKIPIKEDRTKEDDGSFTIKFAGARSREQFEEKTDHGNYGSQDLPGKPVISVDFDGVLHRYSSGWQGPSNIPDRPVAGAIGWLRELVESDKYRVVIFSSRNASDEGIEAMKEWLRLWSLPEHVLRRISFPKDKPGAFLMIDDRAMNFNGNFPTQEEIDAFQPWYKKHYG